VGTYVVQVGKRKFAKVTLTWWLQKSPISELLK
jgi:hypothetical protein